jgi:hypothetical protein
MLYVTFCNNFEPAQKMLATVEARPKFVQWKSRAYNMLGLPPMMSILIMPVQRIPRYVLLLRELLAHTWETHPDHRNLSDALALMQQVATGVNKSMSQTDIPPQMQLALDCFGAYVEILKPGRRFVRKERLYLIKANSQVEVFCFLFNDLLVLSYIEAEEDDADDAAPAAGAGGARRPPPKYQPAGQAAAAAKGEAEEKYKYMYHIDLWDQAVIVEALQDLSLALNALRVSTPTRVHTLCAETHAQQKEWVRLLLACTLRVERDGEGRLVQAAGQHVRGRLVSASVVGTRREGRREGAKSGQGQGSVLVYEVQLRCVDR